MPCLNDAPENNSNFLRWRRCNGVALPLPAGGLPLCYDLYPAEAVITNFGREDITAFLPLVNGDELRFFVNAVNAVDLPAPADEMRIGLISRGRVVAGGFSASFSALPYNIGGVVKYRPYGTLSVAELPDGVYNPYIYVASAPNTPVYIANALKVVNYQQWERDTVMATFRHPGTLGGVPYFDLPADFSQQFRLYFVLEGLKYPEKSETYTDRNGSTRTTSLSVSKTYDLTSSDFVDAEFYEAAVVMLAHDEVLLDGRPMRKVSPLDLLEEFKAANVFSIRGRVEETNFAFSLASC